MHGMAGCAYGNVRRYLNIIAYTYRGNIEHDTVIVTYKIIADADIVAVVTSERSVHPCVCTDRAENAFQNLLQTFCFVKRTFIEE